MLHNYAHVWWPRSLLKGSVSQASDPVFTFYQILFLGQHAKPRGYAFTEQYFPNGMLSFLNSQDKNILLLHISMIRF